MSESMILAPMRRALERRLQRVVWLYGALVAAAVAAWCFATSANSIVASMVPALLAGALVVGLGHAWRRAHPLSDEALARHLDAVFAQLQDSTSLLLYERNELTPLARLQRDRVQQKYAQLAASGVLEQALPPIPWRRLAGAAGAAVVALAVAIGWSALRPYDGAGGTAADQAASLAITAMTIEVQPPAYTSRSHSTVQALDVATVAGATLRWRVALSGPATEVAVVVHDGEQVTLRPADGNQWSSPAWPARDSVYRLLADGQEVDQGIGRIRVAPDLAPVITVAEPGSTLNMLPPGPRTTDTRLRMRLQAADDYGIRDVKARVTLARGSGEQVRFREREIALDFTAADDGRRIAAAHEFDLLALGMEPGDEVFVFVEVTDNRADMPNVGVSETFIVRWPDATATADASVGAVIVSVLPEYFRSQRQIIIDTEALVSARPTLPAQTFAQRAQDLAIDQRALRLRYGAFLGEETDSGIGMVAHDDDDDADAAVAHDDHADGPGGEPAQSAPAAGDAASAMAPFAHFHDRAEQATLFEPRTRDLLKRALAAMWDAEGALRLAQPEVAIAPEYTALENLKLVQQGARIYLRRSGFQPTPIDENRRLSGDLDEVLARQVSGSEQPDGDWPVLQDLVRRLADPATPVTGLTAALRDAEPRIARWAQADSYWLDALGAAQRLQRDPACGACRRELGASIWQRLPPPLATARKHVSPHTPLARAAASAEAGLQ